MFCTFTRDRFAKVEWERLVPGQTRASALGALSRWCQRTLSLTRTREISSTRLIWQTRKTMLQHWCLQTVSVLLPSHQIMRLYPGSGAVRTRAPCSWAHQPVHKMSPEHCPSIPGVSSSAGFVSSHPVSDPHFGPLDHVPSSSSSLMNFLIY